ncbi:MAG: PAS domain S-box protein [Sphingomonadaceae bacterium]|nr:PAS domain S-box protein [Sphingomonadaceae bacterium]
MAERGRRDEDAAAPGSLAASRESEALFRAMADSAPAPIWVTGLHGIEFVNRALIDFSGLSAEALSGTGWTDIVHPDDLPEVMARRAGAWAGHQVYTFDARMRRADGEWRWLSASLKPRFDTEGNQIGFVGMALDVTDAKSQEAELRESEARFRAMADSAPSPVWVTNADGIEFVNKAFVEFAGRPREALTGKVWMEMIHPDEVGEVLARRDAAWRTGADYGYDARFRSLDGTERWMRVSCRARHDGGGALIGYVGMAVDITDAKKAEAALRESEERLRIALAAGALGDWMWDAETDMISISDQGARLFGIPSGPVVTGAQLRTMILPGDAEAADAAIAAAVRERRDYAVEYRLKHPDGRLLWISAVGRPIYHADGRPKAMIGVVQDITARKQAEAELRELNQSLEARIAAAIDERERAEEALRQSQKMEAVGQLTGGIAHDFNNLLTVIGGNVDAARRHLGTQGKPRVLRALDNALIGAERAATLTQRLLAFSRRQPLNPRPIDVNRLVTGMSELFHRTLGETIAVETRLPDGLWQVEVDPNQLENAILNLAVNARDAMPNGGKLTIETANTDIDREHAGRHGLAPGQYAALCVSDIGSGMAADTLDRAFEPFFTTKEVGKGTGLGLSMVYGFVKQSGGHVKIDSEEGEGTTVRIYLPRLVGDAAESEERPEQAIPEGARDETILVCEDDDDVRAYTVEMLRELGYRVLEAHDAPAALRLLARQEGKVDLLFTDVVLPGGMTGAELAREARALRPDLRILFTTGYARNAIVHHGRLDPGVELITKPFAHADLAARVRDMLDRA